jgi:hypothetical protein
MCVCMGGAQWRVSTPRTDRVAHSCRYILLLCDRRNSKTDSEMVWRRMDDWRETVSRQRLGRDEPCMQVGIVG